MRLQAVQEVLVSVQWFLSTTPHFSLFSCDLVWVLHRLQSLWGMPAPAWSHPQATVPTGKYLLQHGFFMGHGPFRHMAHLLIFCLAIPLFLLSVPLFPPPLSLPFLKYVFLEVPPALLMVSAVSCGSLAELAGASCVWHGAAPHLFPQRWPLQPPCCQNLDGYTQYISRVKSCYRILYSSSFLVWCAREALDPSLILFPTFHW